MLNLTGQVFGRLTVLDRAPRTSARPGARWKCRCACGKTKVVPTERLRNGDTGSCGCLKKDAPRLYVDIAERRKREQGIGRIGGPAGRIYPLGTKKFSLKLSPELIARVREFGPLTRVVETALRLYVAQREGEAMIAKAKS